MGQPVFAVRAQKLLIIEILGVKHLIHKTKVVCFIQLLKLKETKCLYFLDQRLSRGEIAILLLGIKPVDSGSIPATRRLYLGC